MAGQGNKKAIPSALDCSLIENAEYAKLFLDFSQKKSPDIKSGL
jgi:hypothetical protein